MLWYSLVYFVSTLLIPSWWGHSLRHRHPWTCWEARCTDMASLGLCLEMMDRKRKENDWIEKGAFLDLGAPNFETHSGILMFFFEYLWLVRIGLLARDSTVPSKKKLTTAAWQDLVLVFDEQGKYLKDFASSIVAWVAYSYHKLVSNSGIYTVAQSQLDEIPLSTFHGFDKIHAMPLRSQCYTAFLLCAWKYWNNGPQIEQGVHLFRKIPQRFRCGGLFWRFCNLWTFCGYIHPIL